ncbi:MAG: 3'-5' exonuclease [Bacteriovoracaceae bacterium]|nr:3'-5' exonuclease [Bacteriovoracaceae bacterium]
MTKNTTPGRAGSETKIELELSPLEIDTLNYFFPDRTLIAFDLETSGFSPHVHEILELGAISIETKETGPSIKIFHELVKNSAPIPAESTQIHGLRDRDLENAADIKTVLELWEEDLRTTTYWPILLAHNAIFDVGHILAQEHKFGMKCFPTLTPVYDSCSLARKIFKMKDGKLKNAKLSTLAEEFGIQLTHHHALWDAWACAKVFLGLLDRARKLEMGTKEDILKMAYLFKIADAESVEMSEKNNGPTEILEALRESVKTNSIIEISYAAGSKGKTFRPIKPISLVPTPQGTILFADCLTDKQGKHFKVKKIIETKKVSP